MPYGEKLQAGQGSTYGKPLGSAVGATYGKPLGAAPDQEAADAVLEARAQESGARQFAPGVLGWAQRILASPITQNVADLISRPNYAVAGAVEEALHHPEADFGRPGGLGQPAPVRMVERAARELFSGIPGVQGEKRGFGQVFERAGVPAGPALSDILNPAPFGPRLFTPTGEGLPLQIGGPLDVTARGLMGFVLDVAADPLTYLTGGVTKGAKVLTREGAVTLSKLGTKAAEKEAADIGLRTAQELGQRISISQLPEAGQAVAERVARRRAEASVEAAFNPKGATLEARKTAQESFRTAAAENSAALTDIIDRETSTLLAAGFDKSEPIYRDFTWAVTEEARQRVAAAARTAPELLDRGGIKWAGLTMPGTPGLATKMASVSAKGVEALGKVPAVGPFVMAANEAGARVYDALGRVFSRDWITRNLPYYNVLKQAHLDSLHAIEAKVLDGVDRSEAFTWLRGLKSSAREEANKRIIEAAEAGKLADLAVPNERAVGEELRAAMDDMGLEEYGYGLLNETRSNYVAHFYDNTDRELEQIFGTTPVVDIWHGRPINRANLGPHNEIRGFDSLADASAFAEKVKAAGGPELRPIWDPVEIVARRAHAHANAIAYNDWYATIAKEFGGDLPFSVEEMFNLTRPPMAGMRLSAAQTREYLDVTASVSKGGTAPSFVRSLSPEGRAEFLRQRLLRTTSREELANVLNKYAEFQADLPVMKVSQPALDAAGKPMAMVNAGALTGVPIPREIADDLANMGSRVLNGADANTLVRGWDWANNQFKTWVTVLFPSFNFRNIYNNVLQAFLEIGVDALDPRLHVHAAGVLAGAPGRFVTKAGAVYTYDELRDLAKELRVAQTGAGFLELTGKQPAFERGLASKARGVFAGFENESRLELWLSRMRHGDDPLLAARAVKSALFDYQNLSQAEKEVLRRAIPFFVWQKKNLSYQIKKLLTRPGLEAAEIKPFRGREDEDRQMTSWEGNQFKLRLNRDGKTLQVLEGIDLPVRNLDILWRGSLQGTMSSNLGMLSPLLKAAIEIGAGERLYTGKQFSRQESGSVGRFIEHAAPQAVKDWLGYSKDVDLSGKAKYTFDGERFYILFQSWALSRIVSTTDRQFRSLAESENSWPVLLDVLTGLKDKTLDLDQEQAKRLLERKKILERLLERQGKMRTFSRTYTPAAR